MDRKIYETRMEQANGDLITALENLIKEDLGGSRGRVNLAVNHILDILDAHDKFKKVPKQEKKELRTIEEVTKEIDKALYFYMNEYGNTYSKIRRLLHEIRQIEELKKKNILEQLEFSKDARHFLAKMPKGELSASDSAYDDAISIVKADGKA